MSTKGVNLFGTIIIILLSLYLQGICGRSSYDLTPIDRHVRRASDRSSSTITESQQTTGSVSGFVNSTAEGNGEPNSAVAYAWQGGQTSAHSSRTATADNSNATAETTGFSNCQQGYHGTAGGVNATSANSIGNALCNATYNQSGQHSVDNGEKFLGRGKPAGFPNLGSPSSQVWAPAPPAPLAPPQVVTMNYTVGQIGEAQSGQTHNSISNTGGINSGMMSIHAGGFGYIPQESMTFQQSAMDNQGQPLKPTQGLTTDTGLQAEEQALIAVSGGGVGHTSGGLAHVHGLGNTFNTSYNSHAPEEDEDLDEWKSSTKLV